MASYSSRVVIFLSGDVMTARGIDQILRRHVDPVLHESHVRDARTYVRLAEQRSGPIPRGVDCAYPWGDATDIIAARAPDIRLVNLETSITTSGDYEPQKGIHYRMHPENVAVLTAAGIDCCALANNHVLDWGEAGLLETLSTLKRAGICSAGAGSNLEEAATPATFPLSHSGRVLVFSLATPSSGVPPEWSASAARPGVWWLQDFADARIDDVARRIRQWKGPSDSVIVSIHWGGNWGYAVPTEHERFARALIDRAGVDIVHGHS